MSFMQHILKRKHLIILTFYNVTMFYQGKIHEITKQNLHPKKFHVLSERTWLIIKVVDYLNTEILKTSRNKTI